MKIQLSNIEQCVGKTVQSAYEGLEYVILDFGDSFVAISCGEGAGVYESIDYYSSEFVEAGVLSADELAKYEGQQEKAYEKQAKYHRLNQYNALKDRVRDLENSNYYGTDCVLSAEQLELVKNNEIDKVKVQVAPLEAEFGVMQSGIH